MSLPKSFKAAVYEDQHSGLKLTERPLKMPGKGQVLVKVLACGICHSDAGIPHFAPLPRIPGHEIVGDIVAVAPDIERWHVGDRVGSGWHGGHCHACSSCDSGDFVTCENESINGAFTDGGFAEYVILRTEALASVPKHLDPAEVAPILCAGVSTYNSLRHMNVSPGEIVAVQGIGGLGHLALQFARSMGYRTVALSSSDSKRAQAKTLGAHEYIDGSKEDQAAVLQKLGGAKVIVCAAPTSDVIQKLVTGLAPNGTLLILAVVNDLKIPTTVDMIRKRLSITGWPSGSAKDCEETIAFAEMQGIKCYIEKFPLDQVTTAFGKMMSGEVRFRSVLVFD